MIDDFRAEFLRYRVLTEQALAQIPDSALNRIPAPDSNSAAMIVRHLSGNLTSRFTDFLTTDGEKPTRNRDREFLEWSYTRSEVDANCSQGWSVLEHTLAALTDADLARIVVIRRQPLSVHAALCRSLAHVAYHVGQLVLLARMEATNPWQSLSIPKGESDAYTADLSATRVPK